MSQRVLGVIIALMVAGGAVSTAQAGVDAGALCKDKKAKATGKNVSDLLKAFGKNLEVFNPTKLGTDISKAQSKLTKGFTKAEEVGGCQTNGDVGDIQGKVESLTLEVIDSICPPCGDDILAPGEDCDGTDDASCPGLCNPTCDCPVCGNLIVDGTEQCDGGPCCVPPLSPGACTFRISGTGCGSAADTDCTNPDTCDATGTCLANHEIVGFACGSPANTDCANPDTCNATGTCLANDETAGFACGNPSDTECTNPDSCSSSGTCLDNHALAGAACGDQGILCVVNDACDGGGNCQDNGFAFPTLKFTTGLPGGTCGHLNSADDNSGANLSPFGQAAGTGLGCSSLYIGGGASIQPPSPTPNNAVTIFNITSCSNPAAMVLAAATSTDTGSNRNCSAPGCFFGPPLPIPNPGSEATSTCVINTIAAAPAAGGTLDATTGATTQTLPLVSSVYVTGGELGLTPCPQCKGAPKKCGAGPNGPVHPMGAQPCTTTNAQLTTHDCPPPGSSLPPFVVDLSPLTTGTASASDPAGDFCGTGTGVITPNDGQTTNGAFGCPGGGADTTKVARCGGAAVTTEYIEQNGSAGGNLTLGPPKATTLASVFCIPTSGDFTVDTIANLPGPGAVTLKGTADLVP
jgi:hypothetical protein